VDNKFFLLVFLVSLLFSVSCSAEEPVKVTDAIYVETISRCKNLPPMANEDKTIVSESFETYDSIEDSSWRLDVDQSVTYPGGPVLLEDLKHEIVKDETGNPVLMLTSNVNKKLGYFGNGISHYQYDQNFKEDGYYTLTAKFQVPKESEVHVINAALEFVVDGMGHFAEIFVDFNGNVSIRNQPSGQPDSPVVHKDLFRVDDLHKWHQLQVTAYVNTEDAAFCIVSAGVDGGQIEEVAIEMPAWSKTWDTSYQIYLETHNSNVTRNPVYGTKGLSLWDDISLEFSLSEKEEGEK
jgi:hypothetical protein